MGHWSHYVRRNFAGRHSDLNIAVELSKDSCCAMSSPHDFRPAVSSEGRTPSQPEAASDQDMQALRTGRQAPRILVVDDHPTIAGLMSQLLTQRGYEVVTAADAEQAAGGGAAARA